MDAEGLFGVEKVEPDSLNLLVNTSVREHFHREDTCCIWSKYFFYAPRQKKWTGPYPSPSPLPFTKEGIEL